MGKNSKCHILKTPFYQIHFHQGILAFGLEKRFASIKDIISPPIKKTATVSIAEGNLIPLWVKLSKRTAIAIFKNPHKTFKIADESFPNGVICLLPIIPVIKWGSELKANIPAKKYITKSVFIFSPPLLSKDRHKQKIKSRKILNF